MTRIVLLPSSYLPTTGGVQELTRHLALALTLAGDEVEIWCTQEPSTAGATVEQMDGLVVRRFPFPLANSRLRSVWPAAVAGLQTLRLMRRAVGEFKPDVLHVQCFGPNGVYATALSVLARTPLIVTLQGETYMDDGDIYQRSLIMRVALRAGLRRATRVTACSAYTLKDAERRFGLELGRGVVIFNGVELDLAQQSSVQSIKGLDQFVIALGRVVPKKGFDLLIRSFAQVAGKHPDLHLAIGGDGPDMKALQRLASELGLAERVRFIGHLSRSEVASVMASALLFVMPSRVEPFGIVLLEAWRAGRAVIATSRGGPGEFVDDGVTGLLVDPVDTVELAAAVDLLVSDVDLRESLERAAVIRVRDFNWLTIAQAYRQLYGAVTARPMT